jgi:hypothetical protein
VQSDAEREVAAAAGLAEGAVGRLADERLAQETELESMQSHYRRVQLRDESLVHATAGALELERRGGEIRDGALGGLQGTLFE